MEEGAYAAIDSSFFPSQYKKMRKCWNSWEKDYALAILTITKRLHQVGANPREIGSQTKQIAALGSDIQLPVFKTRVHVREACGYFARLVYIVDTHKKQIFLVDAYPKNKNDTTNHDPVRIRSAYKEYIDTHYGGINTKPVPISPTGVEIRKSAF